MTWQKLDANSNEFFFKLEKKWVTVNFEYKLF